MKILKIQIEKGFFSKAFTFSRFMNLIYSEKNSVGKTTLLRLIFWGLGYEIPSTKKFNFRKCVMTITLELDNSSLINVVRFNDTLTINDGESEYIYSLPLEAVAFHARIFNCSIPEIINNILGAIYLDQEKGWTLLNRGCVIGKIPFNVESLIRGLADVDCKDLLIEEKEIKSELLKYQKMLDIAEYQRQVNEESGNLVFQEKNEELQAKIAELKLQQNQIEEEIRQIQKVIKDNNSFKGYIERMQLTVISPITGEEIPVNRNTIKGYDDVQQIALVRKRFKLDELQKIKIRIEDLERSYTKEDTLAPVKTLIQTFDSQILNVDINAVAVSNIIAGLKKRKKDIESLIKTKTNQNYRIIQGIYKTAYHYLKELNVEKFADQDESYLFTSDLKSLSGAVLHLTVFAFKLAYIKAIEEKIQVSLPIVIDSPSGKEVVKENVDRMLQILKRDFTNNQVIIASIYSYDIEGISVHPIEKSLMGEEFL